MGPPSCWWNAVTLPTKPLMTAAGSPRVCLPEKQLYLRMKGRASANKSHAPSLRSASSGGSRPIHRSLHKANFGGAVGRLAFILCLHSSQTGTA